MTARPFAERYREWQSRSPRFATVHGDDLGIGVHRAVGEWNARLYTRWESQRPEYTIHDLAIDAGCTERGHGLTFVRDILDQWVVYHGDDRRSPLTITRKVMLDTDACEAEIRECIIKWAKGWHIV